MKIGLLYDRIRKDEKKIIAAARKQGISVKLINANNLIFALEKNNFDFDVVIERCINHARALYSLKILNEHDIKTINSYETAEICGSKFLVSEKLLKNNVKTPRVIITFTPEKALDAIEEIGYPCVLKPAVGSWGNLLAKIKDRESAEAIIAHKKILGSYHHSVYYIQEYIRKPGRDIRVFVIGDKVAGAVYRTSRHWITHMDRGAIISKCPVTDDLKNISLNAARAVNGDFVAVDIVESDSGLQVLEVEYTVEFFKFYPYLDKSITKKLIRYVQNNFPEENYK
ncbi:lysine biosynthesis protein LysX [Candidatus Woesearchaeota archaeon]|nr:lysine biosynthesis protein LysX [Candidatus Woesearchaeota archaeon]